MPKNLETKTHKKFWNEKQNKKFIKQMLRLFRFLKKILCDFF